MKKLLLGLGAATAAIAPIAAVVACGSSDSKKSEIISKKLGEATISKLKGGYGYINILKTYIRVKDVNNQKITKMKLHSTYKLFTKKKLSQSELETLIVSHGEAKDVADAKWKLGNNFQVYPDGTSWPKRYMEPLLKISTIKSKDNSFLLAAKGHKFSHYAENLAELNTLLPKWVNSKNLGNGMPVQTIAEAKADKNSIHNKKIASVLKIVNKL